MLKQFKNATVLAAAGVLFAAASAVACGDPANMTHVGTVAAVDGTTLVIVDAQTRQQIRFVITADQAARLSAHQRVVVQYAEDGDKLVATEISS